MSRVSINCMQTNKNAQAPQQWVCITFVQNDKSNDRFDVLYELWSCAGAVHNACIFFGWDFVVDSFVVKLQYRLGTVKANVCLRQTHWTHKIVTYFFFKTERVWTQIGRKKKKERGRWKGKKKKELHINEYLYCTRRKESLFRRCTRSFFALHLISLVHPLFGDEISFSAKCNKSIALLVFDQWRRCVYDGRISLCTLWIDDEWFIVIKINTRFYYSHWQLCFYFYFFLFLSAFFLSLSFGHGTCLFKAKSRHRLKVHIVLNIMQTPCTFL